MNIYRSGNAQSSEFKWKKFVDTEMVLKAPNKVPEDKEIFGHPKRHQWQQGFRRCSLKLVRNPMQ
jgi:hypothetical protein